MGLSAGQSSRKRATVVLILSPECWNNVMNPAIEITIRFGQSQ